MNPNITRWARLAVASCVAAVVIGCDNSESAYLDQQANAVAVRMAGGDGDAVASELSSATDGSLPVNIQANQLLAQARLSDARALADSLALKQSQANAIVSRIATLTSVAGVTSSISNTYRQMEPTAAVALIKDLAAKARGDGNAEKFSDLPNGSIPTLAAVKQEKSRLEGELAKAQASLAEVTTKRNDLLTQVGSLSAKADQQRGDEKLATVTQAADLRQQAAVHSRTIGELETTIARLNADLGVQAMLETQLDAAVKSFAAQQSALEGGWKETSAKVQAMSGLANSILTADATDSAESSVKGLIAELNGVLKEVDGQREQALAAFGEAVNKFTAAKAASDEFGTKLSSAQSGGANAAEKAAWDTLAASLHGDRFNLEKAIAKREEAAIHTSHARLLLHMADVAAALEPVSESLNAAVPDPFNLQQLKSDAVEAVKKADELITEAKDLVEGVTASGEALAALAPLRTSTKIFVNYDRALLSQLASGAGLDVEVAKEEAYKDAIDAAKTTIVEARESSIVVPAVPAEIYVEPAKAVEVKPQEAAPAEAVADSPVVAELRQSLRDAVTQGSTAVENPGVVDELFGRVKTDESSQQAVAGMREILDLNLRIMRAVKDKFGEEGVASLASTGGGPLAMTVESVQKQVDAMTITETDETHAQAMLQLPIGVAPALKFVKEDDLWKLDLTQIPEPIMATVNQQLAQVQGMKDQLAQLASDIENGKFATIEELKAAMQSLQPGGVPPTEAPAEPQNVEGTNAGASQALPNDVGDAQMPPP